MLQRSSIKGPLLKYRRLPAAIYFGPMPTNPNGPFARKLQTESKGRHFLVDYKHSTCLMHIQKHGNYKEVTFLLAALVIGRPVPFCLNKILLIQPRSSPKTNVEDIRSSLHCIWASSLLYGNRRQYYLSTNRSW